MKLLRALLLLAHTAVAADYYVATEGDDRGPGSKARPFATIARGVTAARAPGDSVIVRQGVYRQAQTLNLVNAGAEGKFITLRAAPGEEVILDGGDLPADGALVAVGTHHVRVEGLTLRNSAGPALSVWGPGSRVHHVEVRGNTIHHNRRAGIYVGFNSLDDPVRDVLLEENHIHHNVLRNQPQPRTAWDGGIGVGMARDVTIRKNHVHQNYGEGIAFYLSDGGRIEGNTVWDSFSANVYLDNATRCRVEGNFIHSTGDRDFHRFDHPPLGISIANENYPGAVNLSSHSTIVNNIVVGGRAGFYYGSYQRGGGLRHALIAHNTFVGSTGALLAIDVDDAHADTRIVNNVFVQTSQVAMTAINGPTARIEFRNNLWHGTPPQPSAQGEGDSTGDPSFVNAESKDAAGFRLRPESPARGKALPLEAVNRDFAGRPRNEACNCGAW